MKRTHTLAMLLTLLPVFTVSTSCDHQTEVAKQPVPVAPPVIQATPERALARCQARWAFGVQGKWVEAYDFHAPEVKKDMPLARYLGGMQVHRYENMRATEVLAVQGDKAFVRVSGLWTPIAPEVQRVKLDPGQTLTQEITMIETWRFVDGDWCYVVPERDTEFFEKHPELLKQPKEGDKPAAPPAK
jgi:hypothetical protein